MKINSYISNGVKSNLLIPGAIVISGLFIGVAVMTGGNESLPNGDESSATKGRNVAYAAERDDLNHIFGNPDAETTIVEFSDFECPFCARLHPTLEQLVRESKGAVKWEYRHLPLPNHRNAEEAAHAAECVSDLAGNDAFWTYGNILFKNQRSLGTSFFISEAEKLGVDGSLLTMCMKDSKITDRINNDLNTARALGGTGTPFSVVVFSDGSTRPVSGALPYEQWTSIIN